MIKKKLIPILCILSLIFVSTIAVFAVEEPTENATNLSEESGEGTEGTQNSGTTIDKFKVGALKSLPPYSSEERQQDSVLALTVLTITEGKSAVECIYYKNNADMIGALLNGAVDTVFPVDGYENLEDSYDIILSKPVSNAVVSVVYKGDFSDKTTKKIAVGIDGLTYSYAEHVYPNSKIISCDNQKAAIQSVIDGDANCALISDFSYSGLSEFINGTSGLNCKELPEGIDVCMAVRKGDEAFLKRLNKGIDKISSSDVTTVMMNFADDSSGSSFNNVWLIVGIALAVILTVVIIILAKANKKTDKEAKLKGEIEAEREKNKSLEQLSEERRAQLEKLNIEAGEMKRKTLNLEQTANNLLEINESFKKEADAMESLLQEKYLTIEILENQLEDVAVRAEMAVRAELAAQAEVAPETPQTLATELEPIIQEETQIIDEPVIQEVHESVATPEASDAEAIQVEEAEAMLIEEAEARPVENADSGYGAQDIRKTISDILPDIKAMTEAVDVGFSLKIDEMRNPFVYCDKEKINTMIIDMVYNALRNCPSGKKLVFNICQLGWEMNGSADYSYSCIYLGDTAVFSSEAARELGGIIDVQDSGRGGQVISVVIRLRTASEL